MDSGGEIYCGVVFPFFPQQKVLDFAPLMDSSGDKWDDTFKHFRPYPYCSGGQKSISTTAYHQSEQKNCIQKEATEPFRDLFVESPLK